MGKYNDLIIEFSEELGLDIDEVIEGIHDFKFEVYKTMKYGKYKKNLQVEEFFKDIFGILGKRERIWLMASRGEEVYNQYFRSVDKFCEACFQLSEGNYNLYFAPNLFRGYRKDKNVSSCCCLFIDIDGIEGIDFSSITKEELINYLCGTYRVPREYLPNWCVCSGHGLHLYYLIDRLDLKSASDSELRAKYTDWLIYYYQADIACRNKSRILRVPYSKNVKNPSDIKRTRLFKLNESDERSLARMNFFRCDKEEVKHYEAKCKAETEAKRKETMEKNGTSRGRKRVEAIDTELMEIKDSSTNVNGGLEEFNQEIIEDSVKVEVIAEKPHSTSFKKGNIQDLVLNYAPMSLTSRYTRMLRDLHNYAALRQGVPVGHRSNFVHIYATFSQKCRFKREKCENEVLQYVEDDFKLEALNVISAVYDSKSDYMYSNERVAEILGFTEYEMSKGFCIYKKGAEARKISNARYEEKRHKDVREGNRNWRQDREAFIRAHMNDMSERELAKELCCSKTTVHNIIIKLRNTK